MYTLVSIYSTERCPRNQSFKTFKKIKKFIVKYIEGSEWTDKEVMKEKNDLVQRLKKIESVSKLNEVLTKGELDTWTVDNKFLCIVYDELKYIINIVKFDDNIYKAIEFNSEAEVRKYCIKSIKCYKKYFPEMIKRFIKKLEKCDLKKCIKYTNIENNLDGWDEEDKYRELIAEQKVKNERILSIVQGKLLE